MADDNIIFKTVKVQEAGAHGGAWKIAYADFVTAMMAFFLLLWLLNATSEEVQDGLANYFQPTLNTTPSTSGSGGIFGGTTVNDPGPIEITTAVAFIDSDSDSQTNLDTGNNASGRNEELSSGDRGLVNAEAEEQSFTKVKTLIEKSIDELPPELKDLEETITVDVVEEGLRIQIIDNERMESFTKGSAKLTDKARMALRLVAQHVGTLPNKLAITGHTTLDDGEDVGAVWALSLQRANSARRSLVSRGISEQKTETVVGRGSSEPRNESEVNAPENRRLSIVLIRMAERPLLGMTDGPAPPQILKRAQ